MIKVLTPEKEGIIIEDIDTYLQEFKADENIVYAVNIVCDNRVDFFQADAVGKYMIDKFKEQGLNLMVFIEFEGIKYKFYELKKEEE